MGEGPALAWFLSVPHHDFIGCLPGNIKELAMTCFPVATNFYGWTEETIVNHLHVLALNGFWGLLVDDNGEPCIYVENWKAHQTLRKEREDESKYVFKDGAEKAPRMKPEEWCKLINSISLPNPPRNVRRMSAECPPNVSGMSAIRGESAAQVQVQDQVEGEGKFKGAPPPSMASDPKRQEAHMRTPEILREWRRVHPRGELYELTKLDEWAILQFIRPLSSLVDLPGFLSKAYAECEPRGKHTLADALDKLNTPMAGVNANGNGKGLSKDALDAMAYIARMKALEDCDVES